MAVGRSRESRSYKAWLGVLAALAVVSLPFPVRSGDEPMRRLEAALELLGKAPGGEALLTKAVEHWGLRQPSELTRLLRWGSESKTDAVLTRYYNTGTGEEHRERQVTIYLRSDQAMEALVLDLAHELVHAISRPAWDPYDPSLTPVEYIRVAIEGRGGEVEAVVAECRVALELASQAPEALRESMQRCRHYLKPGQNRVQPEIVRHDFYRVGNWRKELASALGTGAAARELLAQLSEEAPALYSSTGHTPYPVALYREYQEITEAACENSRRRLKAQPVVAAHSDRRSPASEATTSLTRFLAQRCDQAPKR